MNIEEKVSSDIKKAMLAKDRVSLEALRAIKKQIIEAKTAKGAIGEIDDALLIKIVQKLAKQGKDSAVIYREQNREDLYKYEMAQVKVFETYLPEQLNDDELTRIINAIIEEIGAESMKDMGKIMAIASKKLAGRADGRTISDKVKSLLA